MISFFELPLGGNQRRVQLDESAPISRAENQGAGREGFDFPEQGLGPAEKSHPIHQPAYGVSLNQMRVHAPSPLEQLTQLHHALTASFRQLGDVMQRTDFSDRRNTAYDVADAIIQVLGLQPPRVELPNVEVVERLNVPELVQLLMFLMGRAHVGRAEASAELIHRALFQSGCLDQKEAAHLLTNPGRTPILYAALGAWMFGDEMRPDPRAFLGPQAEPMARDCALIVRALDEATKT